MKILKKCSSILLFSVCAAALSLSPEAYAQKKGVAGQPQNAAKVGATWAYDWGSGMPTMPAGVEYVPMWWGYYGANQASDTASAQSLKAKGAKNLLTYNEPDHTDQANLSVASALVGFKQAGIACTAAGLTCISPAAADDNDTWMVQFMAGVSSQGLKCDYVALHSYIRDPNSFLSYVDGIHNRYGKNLWITEFAPTDWATPTAVSTTEVMNFIKIVIPGLQSRSYVARYSWYCGTSPGTGCLQTAALFNTDGTTTDAGKTYNDPNYVPGGGGGGTLANGTYKIINRNSGKALDVYKQSTTNSAPVDQYSYWGGSCQKWTVTQLGNGQYSVIGVGSGKALDVYNRSTANSAPIDIYAYSGDNCQKWIITATSGGYYKVIGVGSGLALEVFNQSTADSALVDQYSYFGGNSQQWAFQAP
jgi:hypothetical protein